MFTVLLGAKLKHTTQETAASRDRRGDGDNLGSYRKKSTTPRVLIRSMNSGIGSAITINMNLE